MPTAPRCGRPGPPPARAGWDQTDLPVLARLGGELAPLREVAAGPLPVSALRVELAERAYGDRQGALVADRSQDRHGPIERVLRLVELPGDEGSGADRGEHLADFEPAQQGLAVEDPAQLPANLVDVSASPPERPGGPEQPQRRRGVVVVEEPADGGVQVVVLQLQPVQPARAVHTVKVRRRLLGQPQVVGGVQAVGGRAVVAGAQPLQRVTPDRVEHREPHLAVGQRVLADQRRPDQHLQHPERLGARGCEGLGSVEVPAAGEHGQPVED